MEQLQTKYIELLLKKCINFNNSKSLFISYEVDNYDFINQIVLKAKELGVNDIYLCNENIYRKHEILKNIKLEEIEQHEFFNKKIKDEYALKNASFLVLKSHYPGLMDDIEPEKLSRAKYVERTTSPIYSKLQLAFDIPWCYAALSNKLWAKELFKDLSEKEAYNKLFTLICEMCMVNTIDPIQSWNNLKKNKH